MGCCQSLFGPTRPRSNLESSVQVQEVDIADINDQAYVNDDGDKDSAPLLNSPISRVQISASSSTSDVNQDMIQRLLAEVDELSD